MKRFVIRELNSKTRGMLCYARWHDDVEVDCPLEFRPFYRGGKSEGDIEKIITSSDPFPVVDDYEKIHDLNLRERLGIDSSAVVFGAIGSCSAETMNKVLQGGAYVLCVDCEKYTHTRVFHLPSHTHLTHHAICSYYNTLNAYIHEGKDMTIEVSRAVEHSLPILGSDGVMKKTNSLREYIHPLKVVI
jgi:hypothetical protein